MKVGRIQARPQGRGGIIAKFKDKEVFSGWDVGSLGESYREVNSGSKSLECKHTLRVV